MCWPERIPGGSPLKACLNSFPGMFSPRTQALEPDFKKMFLDPSTLSHRPAEEVGRILPF